jgi:hypothetical protein
MYKIRFVFVFFCITAISFSQNEKKTNVNKDIDLVKVYEQVVKEGYGTPSVYKDLANATYFRSEYVESKKWFEKLFEEVKVTDSTLIFRYHQSLKALGLYKKTIEETVIPGDN